jgi:hypothetical protein
MSEAISQSARAAAGITAAILVVAYVMHYYAKGTKRQGLYLTHWNYVGVTALLAAIAMTACTPGRVLQGAVTVSILSLFVIAARLLFLRVAMDSPTDTAWDVHTHVIVPVLPLVVVVMVAAVVRPPLGTLAAPIGAAVVTMLSWLAINAYAQHTHAKKKWVYGKAANPRLQSGRKQLLLSTVLVVACAVSVTALSQTHRA